MHTRRDVHRRRDTAWLAETIRSESAVFVPVCEEHTLVDSHPREPRPRLLRYGEVAAMNLSVEHAVYLGEHRARPCFALDVPGDHAPHLDGLGRLESLRGHAMAVPAEDAGLLAYARAMVLWHRTHRFCPRCGAPSLPAEGGHLRICSRRVCGGRQFPRLDPAVIVLVSHGARCLLGRQPNWPAGRYSTVAGFVEPGEGLEDAVCREVHEETNIRVTRVRYHSSQPWPFPSSLMLGFSAEALNTDIRLNDGELDDAAWFTRDEILRLVTGGGGSLPLEMSIAFRLIATWFDGDEPGRLQRHLVEAREAG
jgi:NAD+ diphosphatase